MTEESDCSTADRSRVQQRLSRLQEAMRRANWDATEGPEHLQSGKFQPFEHRGAAYEDVGSIPAETHAGDAPRRLRVVSVGRPR